MVSIEVKITSETTLYRTELNKPTEIKGAWMFETKTKKGNWPKKVLDEVGEWVIEIDKEHSCLKGIDWKDELGIELDKQNIFKLEFGDTDGLIKGESDKNKRRFWKGDNIKLVGGKNNDKPKPEAKHSQDTTPTDTHYRYCFNCDKWKKKSEINEVDWGEQPGGGDGKTYNCDTCRKDLGNQVLIFRCKDHESEIMKVWGVIDGVNKEKVFFSQCPQQGQEQDPNKPSKGLSGGVIAVIAATVLALIGGGAWYWWKQKKERDAEEAEL